MNDFDFEGLARAAVRGLEPYDASVAPSPRVRVNANENNDGAPERVLEAMRAAICASNRYPESTSARLRGRLAALHGLSPDEIITSNGLDGLFTMLGRAFLDPGDEVVCSEFTFSVYAEMARIAGATVVTVPLGDDFRQRPERFAAAISPRARMLFFCDPNNPTGELARPEEVEAMLRAIPRSVIVILDEAYIDFTESPERFELIREFPNLIICRTFSKIFALAGLRLGWAAARSELISILYRVREPYCVTAAAEAGALAALDEAEHIASVRASVREEREKLCDALKNAGFEYLPSQTNFVMLRPDSRCAPLRAAFDEAGIAVRTLKFRGAPAIRISVGMPNENRQVEGVIREAARLK